MQRLNQNHTVAAAAPHHHMPGPPRLNLGSGPGPQMNFGPGQAMMDVQPKKMQKISSQGLQQPPPPLLPPHILHNPQSHHHHHQNR